MGNCCSDNKQEGQAGKIGQQIKHGFYVQQQQSKFTPAAFANIPAAEKDALLAEVLRLVAQHGDLSKAKTSNVIIKQFISRQTGTILGQGSTYEGEIVEGQAAGRGKISLAAGEVKTYEGEFSHGREHGEGTYTLSNGDKVHSDSISNGRIEGLAHVSTANGDKADRCYRQGQANGPSLTVRKDSVVYEHYQDGERDEVQVEVNKAKNVVQLTEYKNGRAGIARTYVADKQASSRLNADGHHPVSAAVIGKDQDQKSANNRTVQPVK